MIDNPRALFDIPEDRAYLATATVGPLPRAVREAGFAGIDRKVHPWGLHHPDDWLVDIERTRVLFARLVNAEPRDIAVCAATSYGVAVAGRNLPIAAGQAVVLPAEQHLSNVLQWRVRAREAGAEIIEVTRPPAAAWTGAVLAAIGPRTAVVAVPHCDWVTGQVLDLAAIGRRCREVGAGLVVDATQSLGVLPLDVRDVRPDFLISGTFKWLLGPMSMALMYVDPAWQAGEPLEQHTHNRAMFRLNPGSTHLVKSEVFAEGAQRYDVGQRGNFVLLPMVNAGLEIILDWTPAAALARIEPMGRRVAALARRLGHAVMPDHATAPHIVGIDTGTALPESLEADFARERVHVAIRGGRIRVAVHAFNTEADIERFGAAFERLVGQRKP